MLANHAARPGPCRPSSGGNVAKNKSGLNPTSAARADERKAAARADERKPVTPPAPPRRRKISRRRLWIFRLIALTIIPLGFVLGLELVLSIVGYGHSKDFILPERGAGVPGLHAVNPKFSWSFFPSAVARAPKSFRIVTPKPAGTYRIFLVGGSAAQGDPDFAYGMARMLEALLEDRYSGTDFEVVNAAITAVNSHVMLRVTQDCSAHDPDLFIIYLGNNEVVGPFGPGTVFGSLSRFRSIIRLNIFVKGTRIGQLVERVSGALRGGGDSESWQGMETFLGQEVRASDPRMETVYRHFESNLEDMIDIARDADAPVLLSTVAANLHDTAPFSSLHAEGLSESEIKDWEAAYKAAMASQTAGHMEEAADSYRAALGIDDQFADAHFRFARCLEELNHHAEAARHYHLALETDVLRFRADAEINRVIRNVAERAAARDADGGVSLVDVEADFIAASPNGVPGRDLLLEHVHMTFAGNARIARSLAESVSETLPSEIAETADAGALWLSDDELRGSLCFTDYDEYLIATRLRQRMSRPPFSNQLDHVRVMEELSARIEELRLASEPAGLGKAAAVYRKRIESGEIDWVIRNHFSRILFSLGQFAEAEKQIGAAIAEMPAIVEPHYNYGLVLSALGRNEESLDAFDRCLKLDPTLTDVQFSRGLTLARLGRVDEAFEAMAEGRKIQGDRAAMTFVLQLGEELLTAKRPEASLRAFRQATEIDPDSPAAQAGLGSVYAQEGRRELAIAHASRALALDADFSPARALLNMLNRSDSTSRVDQAQIKEAFAWNDRGVELARQGKGSEAVRHFTDGVRRYPFNPDLQINLGLALFNIGRVDAAIIRYGEALELAPQNPMTHYNLGLALEAKKRFADAIESHEKAIRLRPELADAHLHRGMALAAEGRSRDAIGAFRTAIQIRPNWTRPLLQLANLLASYPDEAVRDGAEAVHLAEAALASIAEPTPRTLAIMAAAYAEAGQFDAAILVSNRIINALEVPGPLAEPTRGADAAFIEETRRRLALYESGRPFHFVAP